MTITSAKLAYICIKIVLNYVSIFYLLKVVGRGSEIELGKIYSLI